MAGSPCLGAAGAFLETGQSYAHGSILTFRFMLPEGTEEVNCQGIVRNARVGEGVGIEFLDLAHDQRDRIADFVTRRRGKK